MTTISHSDMHLTLSEHGLASSGQLHEIDRLAPWITRLDEYAVTVSVVDAPLSELMITSGAPDHTKLDELASTLERLQDILGEDNVVTEYHERRERYTIDAYLSSSHDAETLQCFADYMTLRNIGN